MELKLTRPICFFDLETTGIEVAKDRNPHYYQGFFD